MASLVLSHLLACGLAALLGALVATRSRVATRRRDALRWAYEAARAEVAEAREREATARAELEGALRREVAARDDAEDAKALAAALEAEAVAARWEKEELEKRARVDLAGGGVRARETLKELEEKTQGVATLHAALIDAVRQANLWEERAREAQRALGEPGQLIRLDAAGRGVTWFEPQRRAS